MTQLVTALEQCDQRLASRAAAAGLLIGSPAGRNRVEDVAYVAEVTRGPDFGVSTNRFFPYACRPSAIRSWVSSTRSNGETALQELYESHTDVEGTLSAVPGGVPQGDADGRDQLRQHVAGQATAGAVRRGEWRDALWTARLRVMLPTERACT